MLPVAPPNGGDGDAGEPKPGAAGAPKPGVAGVPKAGAACWPRPVQVRHKPSGKMGKRENVKTVMTEMQISMLGIWQACLPLRNLKYKWDRWRMDISQRLHLFGSNHIVRDIISGRNTPGLAGCPNAPPIMEGCPKPLLTADGCAPKLVFCPAPHEKAPLLGGAGLTGVCGCPNAGADWPKPAKPPPAALLLEG